jgi:GNAT superfamily N-acetyltransferase
MSIGAAAIALRPAGIEDAAGIAALMTELGYETTPLQMRGRLERIMPDAGYATMVAASAERIGGMVGARIGFHYARDGAYARIVALIVTRRMRQGGVGRALINAIEEWASSKGAERILVSTALHRDDAHRFYERLDYEHTGRRYIKLLP